MRRTIVTSSLLALAACLLPPSSARAAICSIDNHPAATLLLPYFEVDLNHPRGVTTRVAVSNSDARAELVHVVVWSDLAVPVFDFNMYLTGYDQQTFDLRDVLVNGLLPQTASTGQDPDDTISPKGAFSQDIDFASCTGVLPPPTLPAIFLLYLTDALTGHPASLVHGLCLGRNLGDHIARGYLTMDVVNNCTLRFPGDIGYFGPGGDVTNDNVLFGDYTYVNSPRKSAQGFPLVAIQASATDPRVSTSGNYTFYGSRDNWNASDNREPLATTFGSRYEIGGSTVAATDFVVWRDPKFPQEPFTCPTTPGARPSWYPLGEESVVIFDDQEHPLVPATFPLAPSPGSFIPFPAAAQRVAVGSAELPVPFNAGWVFLDLNETVTPAGSVPPADPAAAQAWVLSITTSGGLTSGVEASQFDNACKANHTFPGGD